MGPIWVSTLGRIFHLVRCLRLAVFCQVLKHLIGSAVGKLFGHLAKSPSEKIRQPVRLANYDGPTLSEFYSKKFVKISEF